MAIKINTEDRTQKRCEVNVFDPPIELNRLTMSVRKTEGMCNAITLKDASNLFGKKVLNAWHSTPEEFTKEVDVLISGITKLNYAIIRYDEKDKLSVEEQKKILVDVLTNNNVSFKEQDIDIV